MEIQVRKRGAQFIEAVQKEFPDMVLLTFYQLSEIGIAPSDALRRQEELKKNKHALLPAFLNGMLDAIAPSIRIVDGCEGSYYNENFKDYSDDVELIKNRTLAWISPENREKYSSHVQAGMALYMDQILGLRESPQKYSSYFLSQKEKLSWFEHNVYYALTYTDEYVWCYSENMNWWKNRVPEGAEVMIRSAQEKVELGQPLRSEIASRIKEATKKLKAKQSLQSGLRSVMRRMGLRGSESSI
jgi:hypothetical protein